MKPAAHSHEEKAVTRTLEVGIVELAIRVGIQPDSEGDTVAWYHDVRIIDKTHSKAVKEDSKSIKQTWRGTQKNSIDIQIQVLTIKYKAMRVTYKTLVMSVITR